MSKQALVAYPYRFAALVGYKECKDGGRAFPPHPDTPR